MSCQRALCFSASVVAIGRDSFGLVLVVLALQYADLRAFRVLAPQFLFVQMRIVGDQLVGRAQDALAAAIVLLELDHAQAWPVPAELVDILRVGAAPGVDRLIVIAHAGDATARAGQGLEQPVLGVVGVLVFVHQQVAQALAPGVATLFVAFQDAQRQTDQVVEIHRIEGGKTLLIHVVDGGGIQLTRTACGGQGLFRRQPAVLARLTRLRMPNSTSGFTPLGDSSLMMPSLSSPSSTEKPRRRPARSCSICRNFSAQGVEGTHGERRCVLRGDQLGHALAHFLRRLVGKGDGGDLGRRQFLAGDQIRDLLRDHAGLARACAGQYQQRAVAMFDGGQLLGIKHGQRGILSGARW